MNAKNQHACTVPDMDAVLSDIASPDETVRAAAVRRLCPCRSGWTYFEAYLPLIRQLQKDDSPLVRASVLHLFEDADEIETEGLPTNRRELYNDMLRTRRASRFRKEPEEIAQIQQQRNKTHRGQRNAS